MTLRRALERHLTVGDVLRRRRSTWQSIVGSRPGSSARVRRAGRASVRACSLRPPGDRRRPPCAPAARPPLPALPRTDPAGRRADFGARRTARRGSSPAVDSSSSLRRPLRSVSSTSARSSAAWIWSAGLSILSRVLVAQLGDLRVGQIVGGGQATRRELIAALAGPAEQLELAVGRQIDSRASGPGDRPGRVRRASRTLLVLDGALGSRYTHGFGASASQVAVVVVDGDGPGDVERLGRAGRARPRTPRRGRGRPCRRRSAGRRGRRPPPRHACRADRRRSSAATARRRRPSAPARPRRPPASPVRRRAGQSAAARRRSRARRLGERLASLARLLARGSLAAGAAGAPSLAPPSRSPSGRPSAWRSGRGSAGRGGSSSPSGW